MQKTSTKKVQSLAERIRSGESEAIPIDELYNESVQFFNKAQEYEKWGKHKQGVEYCRAACEDLDLAYENSISAENFENGNKRIANIQNKVRFYQHRLQANVYVTEQRYVNLLEEIAAAKELYGILLEDNEVLDPLFKVWIGDISELEKSARDKLDNLDKLPESILQRELKSAVTYEKYEIAARIRDRIKMEG